MRRRIPLVLLRVTLTLMGAELLAASMVLVILGAHPLSFAATAIVGSVMTLAAAVH